MKIISWNVNGIRACAKKGFLDFFKSEDPDVLCLQETKAHPDQVESNLKEPFGRVSYWSSAQRKGYSGTATYLRQPLEQVEYGFGIRKFDCEGRMVVTQHRDFRLYNVYFPNGGASQERHDFKQEFLVRFQRHLQQQMAAGQELIVLGDYNVAYLDIDVHDPVRLANESGFLPEEREWFKGYLKAGFVDSFRHFHPKQEHRFTWWSYKEKGRIGNRGWRIDHICVSQGLVDRLQRAEILDQQMGSDHCPILLELKD